MSLRSRLLQVWRDFWELGLGIEPQTFFHLFSGTSSVIVLRGSNGVSLSSALNWYLKYYLGSHVAWEGSRLAIPAPGTPLPAPATRLRIARPVAYSYYKNVCTESYTGAFWGWREWEADIDWMALNGVNLPLVFIGQEYIWQLVFAEYGLSQADLADFFVGPAFLAWGHMGNIQGWGGPLPQAFIDGQFALLRQVLTRMREFGMLPVLPAFAGFVPNKLRELYPNFQYRRLPSWNGFPCEFSCLWVLDPKESLFNGLGSSFMRKQIDLLGTDHFYNSDTFNENRPDTNDPEYLRSVAEAVYESMQEVDADAIWVMQGWLFHYDDDYWGRDQVIGLLSGVPDDRMIILDLFSDVYPVWDRHDSYYGKAFVWSMLHNFGGNIGLYGRMDLVNREVVQARIAPGSTMVGVGLTMEGINQNYFIYELMAEFAWRNTSVDAHTWTREFVARRYGVTGDHPAALAWDLLREHVYNSNQTWESVTKSMIHLRPNLNLLREGFMPTRLHYDPARLERAWDLLVGAITELGTHELFSFDLVEITQQVLSNFFMQLQQDFAAAYASRDLALARRVGSDLLTLIQEVDELLASNPKFLLGTWIQAAKLWATSSQEEALFDFNARNLVTLWGPNGEITDYASKSWAGLVIDYYYPRWALFVDHVTGALANGTEFDPARFQTEVLAQEQRWQHGTQVYSTTPMGDTVLVVLTLHRKYGTSTAV